MTQSEQSNAIQRLTRPLLHVSVVFKMPERADMSLLDSWLVDVMQLKLDGQSLCAHDNKGHPCAMVHGDVDAFLARMASLCPLLCELSGMPVFDPPVFEVVQCGAAGIEVDCVFAALDQVPHLAFRHVVSVSLQIGLWAMQTPVGDLARRALFDTVANELVKPLKAWVPAGKSTIPVLRAAHGLGIPFMHLGAGVYQLGWGSRARRMDRSTSERDTAMGLKLSHDKATAAQLLRLAGLPAPQHALVDSEAGALQCAAQLAFPLVVKPADLDRGEGVTVGVYDEGGLKAAFAQAHRRSRQKRVIVERQVTGECHRLFIADGRLLYAVRRRPMGVTGDGQRSVAQLVTDELARQALLPPWRRSEIRPLDELARATLRRAGWTEDGVPGSGELVPLRPIESTEWGGVDEEVSARVHPDNLRVAVRVAELFGLHMAGVDIITDDIGRPWYESGAIVNEVNYAPLLGGGEISRRHIPPFLRSFMVGDGRIPIEWMSGADAGARALARQAEWTAQGVRCFVTSDAQTLDQARQDLRLATQGLANRVRALLCRPDVDVLIVVGP